jgi:hypothetical protein
MRYSGSVAFGAIAMLASVWPADAVSARDRPGTPNRETAFECRKEGSPKYETAPNVCVMFTNTASERVRFDVEWMANGVMLSQEAFSGHVECARRVEPQFDPDGTQCVAGANLMGSPASSQVGGLIDWQGFIPDLLAGQVPLNDPSRPREAFLVKDLEFDTDYCFRFKARDAGSGVVSEEWSNWACAHTGRAPPKPSAPADLKATFTPAHWDGSRDHPPVPAHVDLTWTLDGEYAAYQEFTEYRAPEEIEPRDPLEPRLPDGIGHRKPVDRAKLYSARLASNRKTVVVFVEPKELDALPHRGFAVCAHNVTGEACSKRVSLPEWHGEIERPNHDATGIEHPNAGEQDTNRPVPTTLPTSADQVGRPRGGIGTEMSVPARGPGCKPGFVWRKARADDFVCAPPPSSSRVAQEDREAASHVNPAGVYGPNTCAAGYVWREAYEGDVVCVTPAARAFARQENADGPSHTADKDDVFRAPR